MTPLSYLSLFTGAGGLDLGFEAAGFQSVGCLEIDPIARQTIRRNRSEWDLLDSGNVLTADPDCIRADLGMARGDLDLLVAGPPCQPFSAAARWVNGRVPGQDDERANCINAIFRFIAAFRPRAVVIENVPGLMKWSRQGGRGQIRSRLSWVNKETGDQYRTSTWLLDAADFGAPQRRRRAFAIIVRDGKTLAPPPITHGIPGVALTTSWDALHDVEISVEELSELRAKGKWADLLPFVPEGGNYIYFTSRGSGPAIFGYRTRYWAFLLKLDKNQPAWTISANPGPATGPFHWENRRLSRQELGRLQTFPKDWEFEGAYKDVLRQVGNSVPPLLSEAVAKQLARYLAPNYQTNGFKHVVERAAISPPAARRKRKLPEKYLDLVGIHPDHPGPGKGPRAVHIAQEAAKTSAP